MGTRGEKIKIHKEQKIKIKNNLLEILKIIPDIEKLMLENGVKGRQVLFSLLQYRNLKKERH